MPEFSPVQTYVKFIKNLTNILSKFINALIEIGYNGDSLQEQFSKLTWEHSDNGFIYISTSMKTERVFFRDVSLNLTPHLMGWTPEVIPKLKETWLELSLLFETEEIIKDFNTLTLKDEVKLPIWESMKLLSKYFWETGVYLTNEATDGRPWEAIIGEGQDFWSFDAAILPNIYDKYYLIPPLDFVKESNNDKLLIVNKLIWGNEPWGTFSEKI